MSSSMIHYRFIVAPDDGERRPERDATILMLRERVRGKKEEGGVINVAAAAVVSLSPALVFIETSGNGRK